MAVIKNKSGKIIFDLPNLDIRSTIEYLAKTQHFLFHADFSNLDLNGIDLSNAKFLCAYFENSDISNANFNSAEISHSQFQKANLQNVQFQNSDVNHSKFDYSNLNNANFEKANLTASSLKGATLKGTYWKNSILNYIDWNNADIDTKTLEGAFVDKLTTIKFRLKEINLALKKAIVYLDLNSLSNNLQQMEFFNSENIRLCNYFDNSAILREQYEINEDMTAYEIFFAEVTNEVLNLKSNIFSLNVNDIKNQLNQTISKVDAFEQKLKAWHEKYSQPSQKTNLNDWVDEESQVMNALKNGSGEFFGF